MSVKPTSYISKPKALAGSKSSSAVSKPAGLEKIEARLQHLSDSLIQKSPYLLTIPTKRPYQPHSNQLIDWRRGSPFDPHEEQLQYLSFLPREPGEDLLIATGGWDNEKGEMVEHLHEGRSGTNTPQQGQGQVKKIPFSHYKIHKAGGLSVTKEVTKPNGALPVSDTSNRSTVTVGQPSGPTQPILTHTQKKYYSTRPYISLISQTILMTNKTRSHDVAVGIEPCDSRKETKNDYTHTTKKARTSPPPSTLTSVPPPKEKASEKLCIPRLLSPTLPPSIEEELSRILAPAPRVGNVENKTTLSVTTGASIMQLVSSRASSPCGSQEPSAANEKKKLDNKSQKLGKSVLANHSQKEHEEAPINGANGTKYPLGRAANGARKEPAATNVIEPTPKSKIVKLKFTKRRKDVFRFLQFPPRAKRPEHVTNLSKDDVQDSTKSREKQKDQRRKVDKDRNHHDTKKPTLAVKNKEDIIHNSALKSVKSTEKRRRTDDDAHSLEPQTKRLKPVNLDLTRKPQTPVPPPFRSPALSQHSSAQKPQGSTPVREFKSIASRYLDSVDQDVKTPQATGRTGTPLAPSSVEKAHRDGRSTSNTSSITSPVSGRSEDVGAWRAEQKRFTELGRVLKHVADDLFKNKDKPSQERLQMEKRAIASGIETIICYILAFTAADNASRLSKKPRDENAWKSILPYLSYIKSVTSGYTLLHGLLLQIEAVCRNTIQAIDMVRLEHQAVPSALPEENKAPTPNVNHEGGGLDPAAEAAHVRKDYIEFKGKLVENARLAQQSWVEGLYELSVEDLQQSFPKSWKRKSRAPLVKSKEKLMIGSLGGDYYLPLSSVSSGVEAARAGWSLLCEWCKKEDIKWEGRLGL